VRLQSLPFQPSLRRLSRVALPSARPSGKGFASLANEAKSINASDPPYSLIVGANTRRMHFMISVHYPLRYLAIAASVLTFGKGDVKTDRKAEPKWEELRTTRPIGQPPSKQPTAPAMSQPYTHKSLNPRP
jgi:hypothetical protein